MKIIYLGSNSKEEIERRIQIVASAGKLSRMKGIVSEVIESSLDYESNLKRIKKIIGYGHRSITEHDYIVFALENVTPIVEQTLINYRLASFTVKSRREVDFRNAGYYIPNFKNKENIIVRNNEELQIKYNNQMDYLFREYGNLVDLDIKKEDCRYILPYSYHSNFIMGCSANELFRVACDLLYGKPSNITELNEVGKEIYGMFVNYAPYLIDTIDSEKDKDYYNDQFLFLNNLVDGEYSLLDDAHLTDYTKNADMKVLLSILKEKYQFSDNVARKVLLELNSKDENNEILNKMIKALFNSKNQRELEQVFFFYEMPISLAVLTHITRHRMQSLLVPDFTPLWNFDYYITPSSIKNTCEEHYHDIYRQNKAMMEDFKKQGVREEDLIYFYLSGQMCNINTTMNARTLTWISRMRCCDKAQWEIRNLLNKMVDDTKKVAPLIASNLGPYCKIEGYCPEGDDNCVNRVIKQKKR